MSALFVVSAAPSSPASAQVLPFNIPWIPESQTQAARPAVCPQTVILAARGSEQPQVEPTRYSPVSGWTSNGWESRTIRNFLHFAEQHYAATHGGESLLWDVQVLGVDKESFPALLYTSRLLFQARNGNTADYLGFLHALVTSSIQVLFGKQVANFEWSVYQGIRGAAGSIIGYEASTGCTPHYIQVGYSQGALVLTAQENWLMQRGALSGSIYIGNPALRPGSPNIVGDAPGHGGVVWNEAPAGSRSDAPKVELCAAGDIVCETAPGTEFRLPNHFQYFRPELPRTQGEVAAAEQLAQWVKANRR